MTTADRYRMLRSGYYRRIELGALIAMGLHAIVFTLAPPYVPNPFRLSPQQPLRLVAESPIAQGPAELPATVTATKSIPAPPLAAVRSEQLEAEPEAAPGAHAARVEGAEGAGTYGDAPPVFYAYDTAPRVVRKVQPEYPAMARAAGLEGSVVINANLDESGRVMRAWVAQSSAADILVAAALDAIYQFEFLPGKQGEHPVKCTVAVPFHFSLKKTQ